jgi:hypothetical protein
MFYMVLIGLMVGYLVLVEIVKKSEDGKWCGIKPPDNAYLWVSRQFVEKKGGADIYDEHANRRDDVKRLLSEQEALYETWMKKETTEEVPYDELIAAGSEANIARLDQLRRNTARLADPRKTHETEAEEIIGELALAMAKVEVVVDPAVPPGGLVLDEVVSPDVAVLLAVLVQKMDCLDDADELVQQQRDPGVD